MTVDGHGKQIANFGTRSIEPGGFLWLGFDGTKWYIMDVSNIIDPSALTGSTIHVTASTNDTTLDPLVFVYSTATTPVTYTLRTNPTPNTTYQLKNAGTASLTIAGNGKNINGSPNFTLVEDAWVFLRYFDGSYFVASDSAATEGGESGGSSVTSESLVITASEASDTSASTFTFVDKTYSGIATFHLKATPETGSMLQIKNSAAGALTVDGNTKNIAGNATLTIEPDAWAWIRYDGAGWYIADQAQAANTDIQSKFVVAAGRSVTAGNIVQLLSDGVANLGANPTVVRNVLETYKPGTGINVASVEQNKMCILDDSRFVTLRVTDQVNPCIWQLHAFSYDGPNLSQGAPISFSGTDSTAVQGALASFDGDFCVASTSGSSGSHQLVTFRAQGTQVALVTVIAFVSDLIYDLIRLDATRILMISASGYPMTLQARIITRSGFDISVGSPVSPAGDVGSQIAFIRGALLQPGAARAHLYYGKHFGTEDLLVHASIDYTGSAVTTFYQSTGTDMGSSNAQVACCVLSELTYLQANTIGANRRDIEARLLYVSGDIVPATTIITVPSGFSTVEALRLTRVSDTKAVISYDCYNGVTSNTETRVQALTISGTNVSAGTVLSLADGYNLSLNTTSVPLMLAEYLDKSTIYPTVTRLSVDSVTGQAASALFPVTDTGARLLGYAVDSGSAGDEVTVSFGPVVAGLTGLTSGAAYYCAYPSGISTANVGAAYLAGAALSTTSIALRSFV